MGAVRKLAIDIISYLKGDGFKALEDNVEKTKKGFLGMEKLSLSTLASIGAGIFSVSKLMETYSKSIESANYQREQEIKLEEVMSGKGFREDQIEGMKRYASELQEIGVVGDEVTIAGMQQLASFGMSEEAMKRLVPVMQDMIVKNKGLSASGEDAVDAAKKLVKSLNGEAGELEEVGIYLNEHQKNLLETGNEEQRLGVIIDAVSKSIGEQNKAFAATPEGKIVQVQNRIGDIYENIGFKLRKSRAEWYSFLGDNLDTVEEFVMPTLDFFEKLGSAVTNTAKGIFNAFSDMPQDVKNTIALIGGFLAITTFPVAGAIAVITDIAGAFMGQKSVTEDAFNALMNYLDYDYNFDELKQDIKDIWKAFEDGGWVEMFLQNLQASLGLIGDTIGVIGGLGKGLFTGDFSTLSDRWDKLVNRQVENYKEIEEIYKKHHPEPKVEFIPIGEDGINYNEPLIKPVTFSYENLTFPKLTLIEQEIDGKYIEDKKIPSVEDVREYGPRVEFLEKTPENTKLEELNNPKLEIPKMDYKPYEIPDIKKLEPLNIENPVKDEKVRENKVNVTNNINLKNDITVTKDMSEDDIVRAAQKVTKAQRDILIDKTSISYGVMLGV